MKALAVNAIRGRHDFDKRGKLCYTFPINLITHRLRPPLRRTEWGEKPCESVTVKPCKKDKSDTWQPDCILPEPELRDIRPCHECGGVLCALCFGMGRTFLYGQNRKSEGMKGMDFEPACTERGSRKTAESESEEEPMKREMRTQRTGKTRMTALLLGMLLAFTACGSETAAPQAAPETQAAETKPETPEEQSVEEATETQSAEPASDAEASLPTTDPSGASIVIPDQVDSVVALAPSICETLVALGVGEKLVGYDLQSVGIEGLPENVPTFDLMNPDMEQLTALAPDMLLVSNLSLYDQETPYQPLIDAGVCVICVPNGESVEEVRSDIRFLAAAFRVPEEGERVVAKMDEELARLSDIVSDIPEEERKRVYFEISPAPYLYSSGSGTYLHELIELAGGRNVLENQSGWISVEGETVVAANPDVIFTNVNYTDAPVEEILGREGWAGVPAVMNREVYYIDNRASALPNQNIVKAVEQMARALYPERFAAE